MFKRINELVKNANHNSKANAKSLSNVFIIKNLFRYQLNFVLLT
jgi:hypothetical protein